jgi:hypothetical protein
MGKSRTADELGKEHFFIPLNLGELATTGTFLYDLLLAPSLLNFSSAYPPADHNVRDYLTGSKSRDEAYDHSCALFESLFTHTLKILLHFDNSLGYVELARAFRVAMTEGQKATGHNDFRRNFYLKVIQMAKELKVQRVRCIQIYLPEPAFTQRKERKKWFPPERRTSGTCAIPSIAKRTNVGIHSQREAEAAVTECSSRCSDVR